MLGLVVTLGLFVPSLSVTVRRLHDIGRSGWWLLVVIAPAACFGFLSTVAALEGAYGELQPTTTGLGFILAFAIACLVLTICLVLPSTKGHNRHGANPRADDGEKAFA